MKDRLPMSGTRATAAESPVKWSEVPARRKGGRPRKSQAAARLLMDVWASCERHKARLREHGEGYGLPSFEDCVTEPEVREFRSNEINPRYNDGTRMVVERYVVRADVIECCELVERAMARTRCPSWFREVLLEVWPRRGKYAGCLDDERGRSDWPMLKYAQRAEVALELGGLRGAYVDRGFGRLLEAMESLLLDAVQEQAASRWGRE